MLVTEHGVTRPMNSTELAQLEKDQADAQAQSLAHHTSRIASDRTALIRNATLMIMSGFDEATTQAWTDYRTAVMAIDPDVYADGSEPEWPEEPAV